MGSEGKQAVVGPRFDWEESDDNPVTITISDPYNTTSRYLKEQIILASGDGVYGKAKIRIMTVVQDYPDFALTLPRSRLPKHHGR